VHPDPRISLLILNTYGTGIDIGELVVEIRAVKPGFPVLHVGSSIPDGLPDDVPTLAEDFTPDELLTTVKALTERRLIPRLPGASFRGAFTPAQASES
jgi:hypothetical protein